MKLENEIGFIAEFKSTLIQPGFSYFFKFGSSF